MAYGPSNERDGNDEAVTMSSPSTLMAEKRRRVDIDEYDEDEPLAARLIASKRARLSGQMTKDDSGPSGASNSVDKGLGDDGVQTQLAASQRRILELESQLKACSAHARATEDELETLKLTFTSDISAIEESVSCGVCCNKLWYPYLLRKCGHSFCEDCLLSWFRRSQPNPTCPECRTAVREMPTENNLVKDLVQNVSNAQAKLGVHVDPCPARIPRSRSTIEAMFGQGRPDPEPQRREQRRQVAEVINPAPAPASVLPHLSLRLAESARRRGEERRREANDAQALRHVVEQPERDAQRHRQQNPDREQRQLQVVQQQRQPLRQDRQTQVLNDPVPEERPQRQTRAPEQGALNAPVTVADVERRLRDFERRELRDLERYQEQSIQLRGPRAVLLGQQLRQGGGPNSRTRLAIIELNDQLETLAQSEQARLQRASQLRVQLLEERAELLAREQQRRHQQPPRREHRPQDQPAGEQNQAEGSRRASASNRQRPQTQPRPDAMQALVDSISVPARSNANRQTDLELQLELSRQFWEDWEGRNA